MKTSFFTSTVAITIYIIIIIAAILAFGYYKLGWFRKSIDISKGTPPDPAGCGGLRMANKSLSVVTSGTKGKSSGTGIKIPLQTACTKPNYDKSKYTIWEEVCFTPEDLGLFVPGDEVPDNLLIKDENGFTRYWFNRQVEQTLCYVIAIQ